MDRWMQASPLFRERPRSTQVVLGLVVPTALGAVAGVLLGVSAAAYWVIGVIAFVGGILAGIEPREAWSAARSTGPGYWLRTRSRTPTPRSSCPGLLRSWWS